ncbi:hypothetical protein ACFVZD_18540 [Streptomyces sp. NPDC058287]|uniref:hypothetical protein n=1 Tax=unclassified Streptomyces TaxID=2593676 RepID=UPI0036E58B7F
MSAVALDGISELAAHLRRAREAAPPETRQALRAVCRAYPDFETERPALKIRPCSSCRPT